MPAQPGAAQPEAVRRRCAAPRPCGSRPSTRARRSARPPSPSGAPRSRALPGSDCQGDVRILAGDFNATLDHPELRALLDRGYVDAADAAGAGLAGRPGPPRPAAAARCR